MSSPQPVRTQPPEIKTSNAGRRYVDLAGVIDSELERIESAGRAALGEARGGDDLPGRNDVGRDAAG